MTWCAYHSQLQGLGQQDTRAVADKSGGIGAGATDVTGLTAALHHAASISSLPEEGGVGISGGVAQAAALVTRLQVRFGLGGLRRGVTVAGVY